MHVSIALDFIHFFDITNQVSLHPYASMDNTGLISVIDREEEDLVKSTITYMH